MAQIGDAPQRQVVDTSSVTGVSKQADRRLGLSPVKAPRPSSVGGVGAEGRAMAQLFKQGADLLGKFGEKAKQEEYVRGQMLQQQGHTLEELEAAGENRNTVAGFSAMQATSEAHKWYNTALRGIQNGDNAMTPEQYQQQLQNTFSGLLTGDGQRDGLITALSADLMPKLVAAQMQAHSAYTEQQTYTSYRDMLVSRAMSGDKDLAEALDRKDNPLTAGLTDERHRAAVSEAIVLSLEHDNDALVRALGVRVPVRATQQTKHRRGALGSVSAKFESGADTSRVGTDSTGGMSFGKYQIATSPGTFDEFLTWASKSNNPQVVAAAAQLRSTDDKKAAWKELAATGVLDKAEHDFIQSTHYDPVVASLPPGLRSRLTGSEALQEAVWSTSVQHGPTGANKLIDRVYKPGMSDKEFINALYEARGTQFGGSTPSERAGVQSRLEREKNAILELARPTAVEAIEGQHNANVGMLEPGNIDVHNRPVVHNADGSISTVRSISVTFDDKVYLLPTVVDGNVVSDEEAIKHFRATGEHLGVYDTVEHADAAAVALHNQQAEEYGPNPLSGFSGAQLAAINRAMEQYDTRAQNMFDADLSKRVREIKLKVRSGELTYEQGIDAMQDVADEFGRDERFMPAASGIVEGAADAYWAEQRTVMQHEADKAEEARQFQETVQSAIASGNVWALDTKGQAAAWKMYDQQLSAQMQEKIDAGTMTQDQGQEWFTNQRLQTMSRWGVVDKSTAAQWSSIFSGSIVDRDGHVSQNLVMAYTTWRKLNDMNPIMAAKYITNSQASALLTMASQLDDTNMDAAAALEQAHVLMQRDFTPEQVQQRMASDEFKTSMQTAIKEQLADIDPGVISTVFGGTASGFAEVWDSEIERATQDPMFAHSIERTARAYVLQNPGITPKAAAKMALSDVLSHSAFIMGSMIQTTSDSTIREDMGIERDQTPLAENQAMLEYIAQHGREMWGGGSMPKPSKLAEMSLDKLIDIAKSNRLSVDLTDPTDLRDRITTAIEDYRSSNTFASWHMFESRGEGVGIMPNTWLNWEATPIDSLSEWFRGAPEMNIQYDAATRTFLVAPIDKETGALGPVHRIPAARIGSEYMGRIHKQAKDDEQDPPGMRGGGYVPFG